MCQSGQQAVSYQSDKLKCHFQSGIKFSLSGCYKEGRSQYNSSQAGGCPVISHRREARGSGDPQREAGGNDRCFPEGQREADSRAGPKGRDTGDKSLHLTGSLHSTARGTGGLDAQAGPWAVPQSPSASESAYFSSHLTSKGLSLTGRSSILCESSLSVGTLLAMVSCSVS